MSDSKNTPSFEQDPHCLESIVTDLEKGQLPLHEALEKFKLGMQLSQSCQATISKAEQQIISLTPPVIGTDDQEEDGID